MSLTAYERETVINMNDQDDFAIVTTYQRAMLTRLRRNPAAELVSVLTTADGTTGAMFKLPARLISIRQPRTITEEMRAKLAGNAAKARESRGAPA